MYHLKIQISLDIYIFKIGYKIDQFFEEKEPFKFSKLVNFRIKNYWRKYLI